LVAVRQPRIKIPSREGEATYHCISRTVNGEWLLDDVAKEVLRRQLWQVADYCGVQVLTYSILSNHFHVLVRVLQQQALADGELLRRYRVLYPKPTRYQASCLAVIEAGLARNDPEAMAWRQRQFALMGDVSQFMKLLKQRFSIWFNRSHQRFGTLWAERFKSVLVETATGALQTMAVYIDLNSVRAGLVTDPKDYRFCGYAEAVAGNREAQEGIGAVLSGRGWSEVQSQYRELLFGVGGSARARKASLMAVNVQRVMAEGGKIPLAVVLRCRIRYFTDGAVLGSRGFVETHLARYQEKTGRCERTRTRPMPSWVDWGDLATLRGLRQQAIT
jgi:REP element-mobilizing transposase RayT